jgi:hypothetical protein
VVQQEGLPELCSRIRQSARVSRLLSRPADVDRHKCTGHNVQHRRCSREVDD